MLDPTNPNDLANHLETVDSAAFAFLLDLEFTHADEPEEAKQLIIKALRKLGGTTSDK